MDSGRDFDTRVFDKVNAPEVLRKELKSTSWRREAEEGTRLNSSNVVSSYGGFCLKKKKKRKESE